MFRPTSAREHALLRVSQPDYHQWLHHVMPAAACTKPIRLAGDLLTIEANTGRLLTSRSTTDMPDGVIYKACGNRRHTTCPSCAGVYQRDAYQLIRAGLVGGKTIPTTVAHHPAVFATLTAPSFGPVHTRVVRRHTCANRRACDCRPEPCHPRRDATDCPHGNPSTCYTRHTRDDNRLGQPLCLDCYNHHHQTVWNNQAGELWRRTRIGIDRAIRRTARARGIDPRTVRVSYGKVAEMQRRGVVHFHAIIRLDGHNPDDPGTLQPPPSGLTGDDLNAAITTAVTNTEYMLLHPTQPIGWRIRWGTQLDLRPVNTGGDITDGMVAGYLAKYATKSTEDTGHLSARLTDDTIDLHANADGTHTERLIEACWTLGAIFPTMRRWAHMLGFGGHFLTKSRRYTVTFRILRETRAVYQRTIHTGQPEATGDPYDVEGPILVVNYLQFAGAGWLTTGDELLANTAADNARERRQTAREELSTTTDR